jgi:hypothetical protein
MVQGFAAGDAFGFDKRVGRNTGQDDFYGKYGRVADPSAQHRSLLRAPLKLARVPNPSRFEGFGF